VPFLTSVVDMLNANFFERGRRKSGSRRQRQKSDFQKSLRFLFDAWIEKRLMPESSNGEDRSPLNFCLRHRLGEDGEAGFFFDLNSTTKSGSKRNGERQASLWFQIFKSVELRDRLERCSYCNRYFLRDRRPKKNQKNKYGAFCPQHRSLTRRKSTKESRERERLKWIQRIADLYLMWSPRVHVDRQRWVVREFNKRQQSAEKRLTTNWLTRHKEEIQAKLREQDATTRGSRG
jgi:hypothetical protein